MRWNRAVIAAGLAWAVISPACAQDVPAGLAECRALTDETARLDCYDRLAEKVTGQKSSAEPAKETGTAAVVASAAATQAAARSAATGTSATPTAEAAAAGPAATSTSPTPAAEAAAPGAASPDGPARTDEFGYRGGALAREDSRKADEKAAAEPEPVLSATVTEIASRQGLLVVTLDNGQVWKQKLAQSFRLRVGDPVSIEPGVLGSFMMTGPYSKRATRVTRVR